MIKQAPSFSAHHFGQLLLQHRRRAALYGFFLLVIAINLCVLLRSTPAQLSCFALMGTVNAWLLYKQRLLAAFYLPAAQLAFISLLFILMVGVLFGYYIFFASPLLIMAFASSGAFLLPFVLCYSWQTFLLIPAKQYPVWYLPATATTPAISSGTPVALQLCIARKAGEVDVSTYPLTVPAKWKLGKVFELFVAGMGPQQHTTDVDLKDGAGQSFGWQFYQEKWFGLYRRPLDPAASLLANQVKPNAKIIVARIAGNF